MKADQDRIRRILTQSVVALCNTGLCFEAELSVEGLLGITLDKKDIFLVNIKEIISAEDDKYGSTSEGKRNKEDTSSSSQAQAAVRKGTKRKCVESHYKEEQESSPRGTREQNNTLKAERGFRNTPACQSNTSPPKAAARVQKSSIGSSDSNDDVVIIKEEPKTLQQFGSEIWGNHEPLAPSVQQYTDFLSTPCTIEALQPVDHMIPSIAGVGVDGSVIPGMLPMIDDAGAPIPPRPMGQNDNTYQVTLRHVRLVKRWLVEVKGEQREVEEIPVTELDRYLADMWVNMRRQDGQEYGIGSLGQIKGRLDYYLKEKSGGKISLMDPAFDASNRVLAAKRHYLKNMGHAGKSTTVQESSQEEEVLWEKGHLGVGNAETLLFSVFYFCSKHGVHNPSQNWCYGNVRLQKDSNGQDFVQLTHMAESYRYTCLNEIKQSGAVNCFKEYFRHRPNDACLSNSPLFLRPLPPNDIKDELWYSSESQSYQQLETWKHNVLAGLNTSSHSTQDSSS